MQSNGRPCGRPMRILSNVCGQSDQRSFERLRTISLENIDEEPSTKRIRSSSANDEASGGENDARDDVQQVAKRMRQRKSAHLQSEEEEQVSEEDGVDNEIKPKTPGKKKRKGKAGKRHGTAKVQVESPKLTPEKLRVN